MKRTFLFILPLVLLLIPLVSAVEYPIKELGNCGSEEACEAYCENAENTEACLVIAEKYGVMSKEELNSAVKMLLYIKNGETPGKCKTEAECNDYCNKPENTDECINFAVKIGEMSKEEADMIKKTGGKGPGGCEGEECNAYCDDDAHLIECVDFAVKYGLMDAKEAEMVKKNGGKGPGGCKGKEDCDNYCKTHEKECVEFAIQAGIIDSKYVDMLKSCPASDNVYTDQCKSYCEANDNNFEICLEWQEKNGRSKEEVTKERVLWFESPGNCRYDEGCLNKYCSEEGEERLFECEHFKVKIGAETEEQYQQWLVEYKAMKAESERKSLEEFERQLQEKLKTSAGELSAFCSKDENFIECLKKELESKALTQEQYDQKVAEYEKLKAESEQQDLDYKQQKLDEEKQKHEQESEEWKEKCQQVENLFDCWKHDVDMGMITEERYAELKDEYEINKAESERRSLEEEQARAEEAAREMERTTHEETIGGESTGGGGGESTGTESTGEGGGETTGTEGGETTGTEGTGEGGGESVPSGGEGTTSEGGGESSGSEGGGESSSSEGGGESSGSEGGGGESSPESPPA